MKPDSGDTSAASDGDAKRGCGFFAFCLLSSVVLSVVVLQVPQAWWDWRNDPDKPFYGLVLDQNDRPVAGATARGRLGDVREVRSGPAGESRRIGPTLSRPGHWSATADAAGRFTYYLPKSREVLELGDVSAPGFGWVTDVWWSMMGDRQPVRDYRWYIYPGGGLPGEFRPDPDRPAVFRMHRIGDPSPAGTTSRGGDNRREQGRWVQGKFVHTVEWIPNEPWLPVIPTAGPEGLLTDLRVQSEVLEAVLDRVGRDHPLPERPDPEIVREALESLRTSATQPVLRPPTGSQSP